MDRTYTTTDRRDALLYLQTTLMSVDVADRELRNADRSQKWDASQARTAAIGHAKEACKQLARLVRNDDPDAFDLFVDLNACLAANEDFEPALREITKRSERWGLQSAFSADLSPTALAVLDSLDDVKPLLPVQIDTSKFPRNANTSIRAVRKACKELEEAGRAKHHGKNKGHTRLSKPPSR